MTKEEYLDRNYKIIIKCESTMNLAPQRFWEYHCIRKEKETPEGFVESRYSTPSRFKWASLEYIFKTLVKDLKRKEKKED